MLEGNDLGTPNKLPSTNNATVTVTVDRNLFPPEFLNTQYIGFINRDALDNDIVTNIVTRDNDTVVGIQFPRIS